MSFFDFSNYMSVWYKALLMLLTVIFGGSGLSYLFFGGLYWSYLPGSFIVAILIAIVGYRQKQVKHDTERQDIASEK